MSGENAPVSRRGTARRHRAPSDNRWITSLARGGTAVAIACAIVGTTIAAAGHVLALAIDAHSDARSLVGLSRSSGGLQWFAEADTTMIPLQVASEPALPAGALPGQNPRVILVAASGTLRDDDVFFTGSIGKAGSFQLPPVLATVPVENTARPDLPRPLPRSRPQLASLTPPDLKLDESGQTAAKTAIYDITARAVYMPNGEKLEAHSGLGQYMDDPKHVRLRMRGVTPPNTYKLTMREALFHGVEAIRMTPENKEAMFGRNGILAHSYMLGPSGQSNGCVSFKDYPKFLAAFKRGEIERMIVVFRLDKPPSFFARRNSKSANLL